MENMKSVVRTPGIFGRAPKVNKVSKVQTDTEMMTPKLVDAGKISALSIEEALSIAPVGISGTEDRECYSQEQIKNTRSVFGANARQSHLFDVLNGVCTHARHLIKDSAKDAKYYEAELTMEELFYYGLGDFADNRTYRDYLLKEIQTQRTGTDMAIYYERDGQAFFTVFKPIIVSSIEYSSPTRRQNDIGGKVTQKVTVLFFKPLFKSVVEGGETGQAFLYVPFALTAALRATVTKHEAVIRKKFGTTGQRSIDTLRRFLLFLLSFDYKKGTDIVFDPVEMAYYCNETLLRQMDDAKYRKKEAYSFADMALFIFQKMQEDGSLDGLKIRRGDFFTILRDGRFKITLLEPINAPWKSDKKRLPF